MTRENTQDGVYLTAALTIVAFGIKSAAGVLGPVILALILVVAVTPVNGWARRLGLPRWAATMLTVVAVYSVVIVLVLGLSWSILALAGELPKYAPQAHQFLEQLTDVLEKLGRSSAPAQKTAAQLDLGRLTAALDTLLGGLLQTFSSVFFLLAVMFFLAAEAGGMPARMAVLAEELPLLAAALAKFALASRNYLLLSTVFGAIVAVLDGVALWLIGVPLIPVWVLLAFLTNYIPNVGFVIGIVPPALLALLSGGWGSLIAVLVAYGLLNVVIQSFIQPRVVGDSVGLSPTVTFLSLGFWAFLLGPLGALLAVPMTLLARCLLLDAHPRRWVAAFIGPVGVDASEQAERR